MKNGDVAMNITGFPLLGAKDSYIKNREYEYNDLDS